MPGLPSCWNGYLDLTVFGMQNAANVHDKLSARRAVANRSASGENMSVLW